MKKMGPLLVLGAAALLGYYLYTGGSVSKGGASGGKLPPAPDVRGKAEGLWSQLYHDPRFYTGVAALILAIVAATFWGKIGAFGRGTLLVVAAVAVTIVLIRSA
jgi:hypothetical protein